jgi:hypothetical protein
MLVQERGQRASARQPPPALQERLVYGSPRVAGRLGNGTGLPVGIVAESLKVGVGPGEDETRFEVWQLLQVALKPLGVQ